MDPTSRPGDADRDDAPFYLPPLPGEAMIRGDRRASSLRDDQRELNYACA